MKQDRIETTVFWAMTIIVAAGIYFRLKGLGKWSFTNDEYYLAQSVRSILENGVPAFKCGGYYVRGILYQYLMVPFVALGFHEELVFRLFTVLSNIIAMPALYKLGKKMSGTLVACLAVIAFSISTLEIELSRFARMYAPFQALFLWYLYFLYKAVIQGDLRARVWMYWLSFASIFVWEGAIFLALLNFLPFIRNHEKKDLWHAVLSVFIIVSTYHYLSFDFRHYPLGIEAYWPPDIPLSQHKGGGRLYMPLLMLTTVTSYPLWLVLFTIPLGLSIWIFYKVARSKELDAMPRICFSVFILFAVFNQYGLLLFSVVTFLLLGMISLDHLKSRIFGLVALTVLVNFMFWASYGLTTDIWLQALNIREIDPFVEAVFNRMSNLPDSLNRMMSILVTFFYYPNGFIRIIFAWLKIYPILTIVAGLLITMGITLVIWEKRSEEIGFRFFASVLIIMILCVGTLTVSPFGIRFVFFLFPVVILLMVGAIQIIVQRLLRNQVAANRIFAGLFLIIFVCSEDVRFTHIWNIDSPEVNFRKVYKGQILGGSYYIMRRDYKGVAQVINRETKDGDIVISAHQTVGYYTDKLDYILFGTDNRQFKNYTACRGKKELWTNADLIYDVQNLFNLVDKTKSTTWIIINIKSSRSDENQVLERYKDHLYFKAQDGILGILKLGKAS